MDVSRPGPPLARRVSSFFFRHQRLRLVLLLIPGLILLGAIYGGSLVSLLLQSLYRLEEFTGRIVREIGFSTYGQLFERANLDIIVRTTAMAGAVTIGCAVLAFPLAYYIAKFATPRMRAILTVAVLTPLWSSYLVRVLAWKSILAKEGVFPWAVEKLRLEGVLDWVLGTPVIGGESLAGSLFGMWVVFVYTWLPFMILPLAAALERVPDSLTDASGDLGAKPLMTFRRIILPLALPGLVAGSIFTFSLTLGDFIIPTIIGNSAFFIGPTVLVQQGTAGNLPLAAAFAVVPIVIMGIYLTLARRAGAFEAL